MGDFASAAAEAERAQVISDLKAARTELVCRGRSVGNLLDKQTGKVCLLGALTVAAVGKNFVKGDEYSPRPMRARRALEAKLAELHPLWADRPLFFYNDWYQTTDDDVLELIDKTLADLGGLA